MSELQETIKEEESEHINNENEITDNDEEEEIFNEPKIINLDQAFTLFNNGAKFIDAREDIDYNEGHISSCN